MASHLSSHRQTLPCVLVEVLGAGVLLAGPSGAGKSDLALALIDRGHRFVADDAVELYPLPSSAMGAPCLGGRAPESGRHMLHLRGLGVVNVEKLYGAIAVAQQCAVDLMVELCPDGYIDAGAIDGDWRNVVLCGVSIPKLLLPTAGERNLSLLVETAVRLYHLRQQGYRAEDELMEQLQNALTRGVK